MKTAKIKKILIALDYDPTAQKVAEEGFSMSKALNAEVLLLHVITDPVNYSSAYINMGPFQIDSVAELKEASMDFLYKIKNHLGDITIQAHVEKGDSTECILKTAKDLDADIIVLGSHSRRWLENIVMGSVAEKVLRQSTIPLFIIPTKKQN